MTNALRLGIAGLGNVGVGVLDIVKKHGGLLPTVPECQLRLPLLLRVKDRTAATIQHNLV
jgi:homoserine dehydrogenase